MLNSRTVQSSCHFGHSIRPMFTKICHFTFGKENKSTQTSQDEQHKSYRGICANIRPTRSYRTYERSYHRSDVCHRTKPRCANDHRHTVSESVYWNNILKTETDQTYVKSSNRYPRHAQYTHEYCRVCTSRKTRFCTRSEVNNNITKCREYC